MFLGLFMAASVLATSCSDDDDSGSTNSSREIKYEVTGNFTGDITAAYTTESGGATTAEITSLPWSLAITAAPSVQAVAFSVQGSGGTDGQQVDVKIHQGGREVSSVKATANSSGIFVASSPAVVF
ncbi:hypothetical protein [Flavobacterium psychrotrophum]|uniref:hypothetical protein n=1 Tax=Flavobacterium psychrotrophum TaxID=2294119 RepID=UPI000E31E624|nr:hypothetical protein [Flavobacterium psychrotrophum]